MNHGDLSRVACKYGKGRPTIGRMTAALPTEVGAICKHLLLDVEYFMRRTVPLHNPLSQLVKFIAVTSASRVPYQHDSTLVLKKKGDPLSSPAIEMARLPAGRNL